MNKSTVSFLLMLALALVGCGKNEEVPPSKPTPVYCDGEKCFSFYRTKDNRCVSSLDPEAQGVFARATSNVKTDDGSVTIKFAVERYRDNGTRYDELSPEQRATASGTSVFLACDTGRGTVDGLPNVKVLHFIRPICSSSRGYPNNVDCSARPAAEQWPTDFRYPKLFSANNEIVAGTTDCMKQCTPGSETALCVPVNVPTTQRILMETLGIDWSTSLRTLRSELVDDTKFPITAARWKQIVGIDPSDQGRGADIELQGNVIQQDGLPATFHFKFQDASQEVEADMDVGRTIAGTRTISGDTIQWIPQTGFAPTVSFPKDPTNKYNLLFGGKITQMYLSKDRFVAGNGKNCLAVAY